MKQDGEGTLCMLSRTIKCIHAEGMVEALISLNVLTGNIICSPRRVQTLQMTNGSGMVSIMQRSTSVV